MNGAETVKFIPEAEGMCKHGNVTKCPHCKAEAREEKSELYDLMESTKKFDEALNPEEYDTARIERLKSLYSQIDSEKELGGGQNETLAFSLESGIDAVYKPSSGESAERLDRNISEGKAFIREWLNHQVELNLELNLVPPTIVRENSHGVGSVQEFVTDVDTAWNKSKKDMYRISDEIENKKKKGILIPEENKDKQTILWETISQKAQKEQLMALAVQDFLTENSDRHVNNFGIDGEGNVIAFDNALSFPEKPEEWIDDEDPSSVGCKTILLKKLAGREIPPDIIGKLEWFNNTPERQQNLKEAMVLGLGKELGNKKFDDFKKRLNFLLALKKVPSNMYKWSK